MATAKRKPEPKPEQADGFRNAYVSSSRENPKWRVGNDERAPVERIDASLSIDLTGRWLHEGLLYHLFINQAGSHIEGVLALVESGSSGKEKDSPRDKHRSATRMISFGADFDDNTDLFTLYLHDDGAPIDDKSLVCGEISSNADGSRLALVLDPDKLAGRYSKEKLARLVALKKTTAKRLSGDPVLLPRHLCQPWIPPDARTTYYFPLTPLQQQSLSKYIFAARVAVAPNFLLESGGTKVGYVQLVKAFFQVRDNTYWGDDGKSSSVRRQWKKNIGAALDRVVWQSYQDAFQTPASQGGIDTFGLAHWRHVTLRALFDKYVVAPADEAPERLLDLTQQILDALSGESLPTFLEFLHLTPIQGGHTYDAKLQFVVFANNKDKAERKLVKILIDKGIKNAKRVAKKLIKRLPLRAAVGLLEVKNRTMVDGKASEGSSLAYDWEGHYFVLLFGAGMEASAGNDPVVVESTGIAERVYGMAWEPEHLTGFAYLLEVGAGAFFGNRSKAGSGTLLVCSGVGKPKHPASLGFDFSGLGDLKGTWGASIGGSMIAGLVLHNDDYNSDPSIDDPPDMHEFEYGAHSETGPLHFPINGALPEFAGCELLEIFCASELHALSRKGCELQFDGYADQPHSVEKNLILSRNRAISCYVYMKNILGARGKHLPELKPLPPEDEEVAELKEREENSPEEIQTLKLDAGHVELVGHGEPEGTADEKPAQYDSDLRRVDVTMNSSVLLRLRRMKDK